MQEHKKRDYIMDKTAKTNFIVVSGGVISGVGKGVITASIGKILHEHGYKTTLIKIDPYINYDAGTLRPTEHGEVWVTCDGGEIDQDLGTYERFTNQDIPKKNNITTGQVYQTVITKERNGEYLGQTVQFIPHITDEIIARIQDAAQGYEFAVIEIGGTAGDHENVPFLYAVKALEREFGVHRVAHVLVTYLPVPGHIKEMKTKPTQQAISMLGMQGIMPDFIVCRSHEPIDDVRKKKIEVFAHISSDHIISAPDIDVVYELPLLLEQQQFGTKLLRHFNSISRQDALWDDWQKRVECIKNPSKKVSVAVVGKYLDIGDFSLTDSYLSVCHSLIHAGAQHGLGVSIAWIDAKQFEHNPDSVSALSAYDGVVVPGGFGASGVEGKIKAIEYVRLNGIPYLGLCYGMQLAAVEFARNVCHLDGAHTTEVDTHTPHPIVDIIPMQKNILYQHRYGGTMRLGSYPAHVIQGSKVYALYNKADLIKNGSVFERHRHRYEVNPLYVDVLASKGLVFSGVCIREDGTRLMEFIEIPTHPFFVATQAHPEFTSRFEDPNPLFAGFVAAAQLCKDKRAPFSKMIAEQLVQAL
jgi:CTP synthase